MASENTVYKVVQQLLDMVVDSGMSKGLRDA
jgi:hypothetical protein